MSAMERAFLPTERMIAAKRQQLVDVTVAYVRDGKEGTMRDRLRVASQASGIPISRLEAEIGDIDRLKANRNV